MSKKRKIIPYFLVIATFILSFSISIFADFGPKPSIEITIPNPPQVLYYLDLLIPTQTESEYISNLDDESNYNTDMLGLLKSSNKIPEGWHAALTIGSGAPLWGSLTGQFSIKDGSATHQFSYFGVPDTYRIIIVTKEGEVFLSDVIEKEVFDEHITVQIDYDAKTIQKTEGSNIFLIYVIQLLITLIPTLILEFLILLLFRIKIKKNWLPFLIINIITQIALQVIVTISMIQSGMLMAYINFFIVEFVILFIEMIAYMLTFKDCSRTRAALYGFVANIVSCATGFALISVAKALDSLWILF